MTRSLRCPKCGLVQMATTKCRSCGQALAAEPAPPRGARPPEPAAPRPDRVAPRPPRPGASGLDPAFDRMRFLLKQKVLTIHAKYEVADENGQAILYVERPAHFWRNALAMLLGVVAGLALVAGIFLVMIWLWPHAAPTWGVVLGFTLMGVALVVVPFVVFARVGRARDVLFYRDPSRTELLLAIRQDRTAALLEHTYTVVEPSGQVLAHLKKNIFSTLYRTRWVCDAPDGRRLVVAIEDSLLRALVRRYVIRVTPMNFVFWVGETDQIVGRFNRKFTLLDRYVLDLTEDPAALVDRRIALALGVVLDTGERR